MAGTDFRRREIAQRSDTHFKKVEFRSAYVNGDRLYDSDHGDANIWISAENAQKKRRRRQYCISNVSERANGE